MDIALQGASRGEDLIALDDARGPYAFAKIFEPKGWGARRRNRGKLLALQSLDATLSLMLHDGERVVCVTLGQEYSFVESFFMGLWALLLNRRALLLTTERMLVLQVSRKYELLELKSQIRYGAINKVAVSFGRSLTLKFKKGRAVIFNGLQRASKKELAAALEGLRRGAPPANAEGREHLCAHCYEPIAKLVATCPKCRGTFKSPRKAALLSLALPGLGDLYLGHRWLGAVEVLGALLTWGVLGAAFAAALLDPKTELADVAGAGIALALLVIPLHGLDAAVTGFTARKGLYGDAKGPAAISGSSSAPTR